MQIKQHYVIYEIRHPNGRYYRGRHSTNKLNDSYIGSGLWVDSIEDKSLLTKIILDTSATTEEELKLLEEKYINEVFDDPMNMNYSKSSVGLDSALATKIAKERIENGTHHRLATDYGARVSAANKRAIQNGTHNWTASDYIEKCKAENQRRIENGTHHLMGKNNHCHARIAAGISNLQTSHPGKIKVSCIYCKKETTPSGLSRGHNETKCR